MRSAIVTSTLIAVALLPLRVSADAPVAMLDPAVTLRQTVTVSDDLLRLGDLFDNAGDKAEVGIAPAPAPGRRMVLDARSLYRLAHAHGLNWQPSSNYDRAVVNRDSQVITVQDMEEAVVEALGEQGIDTDQLAIELAGVRTELHVPADAGAMLSVEDLDVDAGGGRFTALVAVIDGEEALNRVRISGRMHQISEVPVLSRRVLRNEVIRREDIDWVRMRSSRLPASTIFDAEALIGFTPTRGLRAQVPVRTSDVQRPIVVAKGALVTLELSTPMMALSTRGRALDDGSEGDTIRVTNARSHSIVEGVVVATGRVAVSLPAPLARQQEDNDG